MAQEFFKVLINVTSGSAAYEPEPIDVRPKRWSVLYVYGWHEEYNEPTGGQTLETCETVAQAYRKRDGYLADRESLRRRCGEGRVVVCNWNGAVFWAEPGMPGVVLATEDEEETARLLELATG